MSQALVTLDDDVAARRRCRRARGARARRREAHRLPQGDGVHHAHPARRRGDRHRCQRDRGRPAKLDLASPPPGRPRVRAAPATPGWGRRRNARLPAPAAAARRQSAGGTSPGALTPLSPLPPRPAKAAHRPHRPQRTTRRSHARRGSTPGSPRRSISAASPSTPRPPRSIRCRRSCVGISLATAPGRGRLRAARPHKDRRAAICSAAAASHGQIPEAEALARLKPLLEDAVGPQDRAEPQIRLPSSSPATASMSRPMTTPC